MGVTLEAHKTIQNMTENQFEKMRIWLILFNFEHGMPNRHIWKDFLEPVAGD